jgi:putative aldouronate transport system permease protein
MIIFYSVHHWNSFFPALIYLNDKSLQPLQIILRNIVIDGDMAEQSAEMVTIVAQNFKYAFVIVAITPILAVYPFLQRYFVQGAMLGAVKG